MGLNASGPLPTEQHFLPTWSDPQGLGHPPSPLPALRPPQACREKQGAGAGASLRGGGSGCAARGSEDRTGVQASPAPPATPCQLNHVQQRRP